MGWLYKHDPIDDPVAYLTGQFTHTSEQRTNRVLDAARVASTVYMAVSYTHLPICSRFDQQVTRVPAALSRVFMESQNHHHAIADGGR